MCKYFGIHTLKMPTKMLPFFKDDHLHVCSFKTHQNKEQFFSSIESFETVENQS